MGDPKGTPPKNYFVLENVPQDIINTSLAAQGALAHRLQRHPRPIHNNADSVANPSLPHLDLDMARGRGAKNNLF